MKTKNNSPSSRFIPVKKTGNARNKSNPAPQDFTHAMLYHPDMNIAVDLISEQTGLNFDHEGHSEIHLIKFEQDEINKNYKTSSAIIDTFEKKKCNTKEYIKSVGTEKEIPFNQWKRKDQIILLFLIPMIFVAMVMGAANVYANLLASSTVIFVEKPWLAIALSTLVPIGSLSIKFVSNFLEIDRSRRNYSLSIFILTFGMLMVWTVLFAMNFNGVSGGIDWENMGDTTQTGSLLVWSQLLLEILMASALALAAEDIYMKYSPDAWAKNMEFVAIEKALKAHLQDHKELRELRNNRHARLIKLEALRQTTINEETAQYMSLRARFAAKNDPNYNI